MLNGISRHITIAILLMLLATVTIAGESPKITLYNDGESCPGGCDAHVVLHRSLNGTRFAHAPGTQSKRCEVGVNCEICFEGTANSCMDVMYRGGGPARGRLDFTPAFFNSHCGQSSIPTALVKKCAAMYKTAMSQHNYINCIKEPTHPQCIDTMAAARDKKAGDAIAFKRCRTMGLAAYNKSVPALARRSDNCTYSQASTGGPNSHGETWRQLLPGACPGNSYVGRDGLDCCTGDPFIDASLGFECRAFYLPPNPTQP